jgi:histidine kinase/DNA gyrase B/HSP90-like ATPase
MKGPAKLKVTSQVGRDILASAAHFKTEASVVWEYVANSLQYVDPGVTIKVQVVIKPKDRSIEIRDNGTGMDAEGFRHFFTMHGENLERRIGRPGRGKFGTGKSAAFGIAKSLRVDTRRKGIRNVAELRREMIDASAGGSVPVTVLLRDESFQGPNGTTVTIGDVILDRINTISIIEYIERHLSSFRYQKPEVEVNGHPCVPKEITITDTKTFRPSFSQSEKIGEIELTVKISQVPLDDEDQGIHITAGIGNLVAIERAGLEKKEFGNYLFGESMYLHSKHSRAQLHPTTPHVLCS